MPSARILLVDENPFFRELVSGQLRGRGHEVELAESSADALLRLGTSTFDVVIADLAMAGLDGIALTGEVRRRVPDQEVLLVTQHSDVSAVVAALRAGASDYLLKPVHETELVERVNRSLERAALRRERAQLLDENLEFLRDQVLYHRSLSLLSTLDLERLQETCLADLCSVCDAQSGALWVADDRGVLHLRAYRGLIDRTALQPRIDPRSGVFAELLPSGNPFPALGQSIGRSFHLPLRAAGELVGLLVCADKLTGEFVEADHAVTRAVGDFAATALRNARRYAAVERRGLRDHDTGAYNLAYFLDYAGKEIYKARRYGRVFSLLTLSLDRLEHFRASRGAQRASTLVRAVIAAVSGVARDSDVIAKAAADELYVLLPETDYLGALVFARRLRTVFESEKVLASEEAAGEVAISIGAATFPRDGQDFDELLHVCRRRTEEARTSLALRLDLGPLDFWSSIELLLGDRSSPRLPADDRAGPTRRGLLPANLFEQLQLELALEIARNPRSRGLLYVGCGELAANLPLLEAFEQVPPDSGMRVYLLGRRGDAAEQAGLTPVYLEGDEQILKHQFVLMYSEDAAYALVQRRTARGAPWGFHTSDAALVDELVDKLQRRYDLQPL